jgi:hypothetical protein
VQDDFYDASDDPIPIEPAAILQPAKAPPKRSPRLLEEVNKALLCVALTATALDIVDPVSFREAMRCGDKDNWYKAMVEELNSILSNNTFKLGVLPPGRSAIKTRLVYRTKRDAKGNIIRDKARLVCKGFTKEVWP